MQSVHDFFPDELKEQNALSNLKPGSVLKFFVNDTNPPKVKIMIVVGVDASQVSFVTSFVNSEINPNLFRTAEFRDLHIEIVPSVQNSFLDHTSYIDCSQVVERGFDEIKLYLKDNPKLNVGQLEDTLFQSVLEKIRTAVTIARKIKKKYGLA